MQKREKNMGIEILRIISMLMVLFLHVLGQGGVYPYAGIAASHPMNHPVSWLMETASFGAVDLFALISGYVSYKSKIRTSKYLKTWLLVSFWGVMIVLAIDKFPVIFEKLIELLKFFIPSVKTELETRLILPDEYIYALFPVSNNQYWYFNAYTLAFFAMPILNRAIEKLGRGEHFCICCGVFILTSVIPTISNADLFVVGYGYSAIWLMLLYFIGAYIAKYPTPKIYIPSEVCLMGYLFCTAAAWHWMFYIEKLVKLHPEDEILPTLKGQFIQYTSPFILAGSILLLILASRIRIGSKPIKAVINFFAPATFGVYIIHVQPIFWNYFMLYRFWKLGYFSDTLEMAYYVVVAVAVLFVVCILLERIRMLLFKILQIDRLTEVVGKAADSFVGFIIGLFNSDSLPADDGTASENRRE